NEYKYQMVNSTGHSWVSEFNQQCNKVQTGLIGTFVFLGVLLGALLFQVIAEKFGRKYTIIIACSGYILCLIVFQFASSIYYLWICSVFIQIFASIGNLGSYLLMNEVTSVSSRSVYGAVVQSAFSLSGTLFIGLYYSLDSWRQPFLVASIIALINL
ncbi:MAG: MFS transporter, partial [Flammeovirgaceae bacterium]